MKNINWNVVKGVCAFILFTSIIVFTFSTATKIDAENWEKQKIYEMTSPSSPYMHTVYKFDCDNDKEYLAYINNGGWWTYPENNQIRFDDSWFNGIKCNKIKTEITTIGKGN